MATNSSFKQWTPPSGDWTDPFEIISDPLPEGATQLTLNIPNSGTFTAKPLTYVDIPLSIFPPQMMLYGFSYDTQSKTIIDDKTDPPTTLQAMGSFFFGGGSVTNLYLRITVTSLEGDITQVPTFQMVLKYPAPFVARGVTL